MSQLINSEVLGVDQNRCQLLLLDCLPFCLDSDTQMPQSQPAAVSSLLANPRTVLRTDPFSSRLLPPHHHHHHFFLLLFSCSCLIVNQGENNIGVFRHSMPPHSCGALSAQIQSRRRPLAQPSATMSGRLGKAQWCRLGESSWMALQVCGKEKGMEIFFWYYYIKSSRAILLWINFPSSIWNIFQGRRGGGESLPEKRFPSFYFGPGWLNKQMFLP